MCCATDIGVVRRTNQDSVAVFPDLNLAVLADGMGGHLAGDVASRKAIGVVRDVVREGKSLEDAVVQANAEVYGLSEENENYTGMGTTLVAAHYDGLKVKIANVGDSRMYRFRKGRFEQLTVDQTVAQELRDKGLNNKNGKHISAFEHVLTNALGIQEACSIVINHDVVQPGDLHLLCSDGLTGVLEDETISGMLTKNTGALEGVAQTLFNMALLRDAPDNISTAIIQSVLSPGKEE